MRAVYTRRRLFVVAAGSTIPLAIWSWSRTSAQTFHNLPPTASPPPPSPPATEPTSTLQAPPATPVTAPTTTAAPVDTVPTFDHDLRRGMSDPKVAAVQARLSELGFDPGPADGYFGDQTVRAVWAFEKLVMGTPRDDATGIVTAATWGHLHAPVVIEPRRQRAGTHVEVYLPEQVAAVFTDSQVVLVTHISSGDGEQWCQEVTIDNDDGTQTVQGRCGISITPGGIYRFNRRVDGWRNAALGRLYNPVYFNYGIAIHGATSVPDRPASRGCIRIPMHIAEYFPELVANGDTVFVFDGIETPEHHGAQLPVFDWRDPDWIDPNATTTTTSTTTTSTVPPDPAPATSTTTSTVPPDPAPATSATTSTIPPDPAPTPPTSDGYEGRG